MTDAPWTLSRRVATGAGLGVALTADLLVAQAIAAFRRDYASAESAPAISKTYGDDADPTVRLVLIGDSTAAGVGVIETDDSVGGRLATLLTRDRHRIELSGVAVSGSRAGDLGPQVSRALLGRPDVAVVLIGANDATHATPLRRLRPALSTAVRRLRAADVQVVLGTCPDLGAARALARPLRDIAAAYGRVIGAAEAEIGRAAGAHVVDIAAETGAAFRAEPQATLCSDAFHPSAVGYDLWARALLPAVQDAIGTRVP